MARCFDDAEPMVSEVYRVVAREQSAHLGKFSKRHQSEEFLGLLFGVGDEVLVVAVNFDFQAEFVEYELVSKVVVEVSVSSQ